MRLDDQARRAAEDVRARARSGPSLGFEEWHARRRRRAAVSISGFALFVVFGIALGSALTEDDTELAVDTTLPPEVLTTTTEAMPSATATTIPSRDGRAEPDSILGAGWERLDYGPLTGGRYRMATAWSGEYLFVWGGHLLYSQETPPSSEFLQDGYLYHPATGEWTPTGAPPLGQCHLGLARAIPVPGGVIVHGSVSVGGLECPRAAFYDIEQRSWTAIESELFEKISSLSPLANTGDMLVAPGAGLAYQPGTGETTQIPRLPAEAAGDPPGPAKAHWTGSEVIVVGTGSTYSWAPGDDAWTEAGGPHTAAAGSTMTDTGLLVIDYDPVSGAYSIAPSSTGTWDDVDDIPAAHRFCAPEVVSAGGTTAIRTCFAVMLWDDVRSTWVPVPLEDVAQVDLGTLVVIDGGLYSVGRSLRRFEIRHAEDGSIVLPPTIPIGQVQLDVPSGFEFTGSFRDIREPAGESPGEQTVGAIFDDESGERQRQCLVSWTYGGLPSRLDHYPERIGPIAVGRPGRTMLPGAAYRDPDDTRIAFLFYEPYYEPDSVLVACAAVDADVLSDTASLFAARLWSPWEVRDTQVLDSASLVVTPQAGPSGTVMTLEARNFPSGWSEWWMIDELGNAVAEVPSDFYPHDIPDFTFSVAIDVSGTAGLSAIGLVPGSYHFAVDGLIIPGATFTKIWGYPRVEIGYVFETGDAADPIGTVELENRDSYTVDLTGWTLEDEISPTSVFGFPAGTVIDPGRRIFVEYQRSNCPSPTEADFVVCTDPPRGAVMWDSIALRESHGELVDRHLISEPCPWTFQPEAPRCGFVLFHDPDIGMRYQVPADSGLAEELGRWHIADVTLTPSLGSPGEILSLGTYPLRQGGSNCAQIPENALEDLGPLDAFISIQRRAGGAGGAFSPRPDDFTYEWLDAQAYADFWDCLDRIDRDELYLRWGSFADGIDLYYVIVGLGQDAFGTVRAEQVLDILNGLDFDPS